VFSDCSVQLWSRNAVLVNCGSMTAVLNCGQRTAVLNCGSLTAVLNCGLRTAVLLNCGSMTAVIQLWSKNCSALLWFYDCSDTIVV
jgi:hypothetical protein